MSDYEHKETVCRKKTVTESISSKTNKLNVCTVGNVALADNLQFMVHFIDLKTISDSIHGFHESHS